MARRTSRRRIRDKLDAAATQVTTAEGKLAEIVAIYHESGLDYGYLVELMRSTLESTASQIRDFRATRS